MTHGEVVDYHNTRQGVVTQIRQLNGVHVSVSRGPDDVEEYAVHPFGKVSFGQAVT